MEELETLGGDLRQNEQGEVVGVDLFGSEVTDAGLAHLTGLTALETLHLGDTQVTGSGLAHFTGLTALEVLDLEGTQVTDAGLAHLTGLTGLEFLFLDDTQVTEMGVAELQQALPNCRISTPGPIPPPAPPQ